ncbi:hypothetical protein MRX96_048890 [Rhipicephalus microplus]
MRATPQLRSPQQQTLAPELPLASVVGSCSDGNDLRTQFTRHASVSQTIRNRSRLTGGAVVATRTELSAKPECVALVRKCACLPEIVSRTRDDYLATHWTGCDYAALYLSPRARRNGILGVSS